MKKRRGLAILFLLLFVLVWGVTLSLTYAIGSSESGQVAPGAQFTAILITIPPVMTFQRLSTLAPTPQPTVPADSDGDGIPDGFDECPLQPAPGTANGCPPPPADSDNDGIIDINDACPFVSAPGTANGCPLDRDGDGIPDANDACPDVSAPGTANGCPLDRDGDGIPDANDACPNVSAPGTASGCPIDSDGDGIPDINDACPNISAPGTANGCRVVSEDSDGDGIPDTGDSCPFDYAPGTANGCPNATRTPIPDSDGDGIVDTQDQCPAEPAPRTTDGCPIVPGEPSPTPLRVEVLLADPVVDAQVVLAECPNLVDAFQEAPNFLQTLHAAESNPCQTFQAFLDDKESPADTGINRRNDSLLAYGDSCPLALVELLVFLDDLDAALRQNIIDALTYENTCETASSLLEHVPLPEEIRTIPGLNEALIQNGTLEDTVMILHASDAPNAPADLYLLSGGELQQLTTTPDQSELFPVMKPGENTIVFLLIGSDGAASLNIMNVQNRATLPVWQDTPELSATYYPVTWSPDGKSVLLTLIDSSGKPGIYHLDLSDLTNIPAPQQVSISTMAPFYAPDGSFIIIESQLGAQHDIAVIVSSNRSIQPVTSITDGVGCFAPSTNHNADTLYFMCGTDVSQRIYAYAYDGLKELEISAEIRHIDYIAAGPVDGYLTLVSGNKVFIGTETGIGEEPVLEFPSRDEVFVSWR